MTSNDLFAACLLARLAYFDMRMWCQRLRRGDGRAVLAAAAPDGIVARGSRFVLWEQYVTSDYYFCLPDYFFGVRST